MPLPGPHALLLCVCVNRVATCHRSTPLPPAHTFLPSHSLSAILLRSLAATAAARGASRFLVLVPAPQSWSPSSGASRPPSGSGRGSGSGRPHDASPALRLVTLSTSTRIFGAGLFGRAGGSSHSSSDGSALTGVGGAVADLALAPGVGPPSALKLLFDEVRVPRRQGLGEACGPVHAGVEGAAEAAWAWAEDSSAELLLLPEAEVALLIEVLMGSCARYPPSLRGMQLDDGAGAKAWNAGFLRG